MFVKKNTNASHKNYVCFDADNDINYYRLMTSWKENDNSDFNFYNAYETNTVGDGIPESEIKANIFKGLENTKTLVVIIGENTKSLYKYSRWEIEWAIENDIPIVAVNINKKKVMDDKLCPDMLKCELAIHIPFGKNILNFALKYWPSSSSRHKKNGERGAYIYAETVYRKLESV